MITDNRSLKITLWISACLYTFSLFFSGFSTTDIQNNQEVGILLVLFGWYDIFGSGAGYVWLANPIIWGSWLTIRNPKKSFIFALVAFSLMLLFAFSKSVRIAEPCGSWLESSDCPEVSISDLRLGYYLWLASAVTSVFGNLFRMLSLQRDRINKQ
jgi:hypothetical protein